MTATRPVTEASAGEASADFEALVRARKRRIKRALPWAVAAVAALMAIEGIYRAAAQYTYRATYRTPDNVTSVIELADGSSVRLDPSSRLELWKDLVGASGNLQRYVELQGAADFTVTSLSGPQKLRIRTRHAEVQAEGPRFRVEEHDGFTRVVVERGSVLVHPIVVDRALMAETLPTRVGAGERVRVLGSRVIHEDEP